MKARTVLSFSLALALAACGDSSTGSPSATPVKDSATAKASGATSAPKAQTSTSAAPPPTVAASTPASASASAVASATAPKVVSSAPAKMSQKEQDDLLAQMMGSGPAKPAASTGPATPAAAAPAGDKIADAFSGAPDASIKLGKTLKVAGFSIDIPDGWEGTDTDNVIKASSKGKGAWIFVTGGAAAAKEEDITAFLKKTASADGTKWSPANPFKVGKAAVDGKLAKGTGKVGADDADFTYFLADDGKVYLTTAATKKSTDEERNQLVAAVRSFRK